MKVQKLPALFFCICYLFLSVTKSHQKRIVYTGYETHRFFPDTDENLKIMKDLQRNNPGVMFMTQPGNKNNPVDILFPPHLQDELLINLQDRMPNTLIMDDIEALMDHESHIANLEDLGDNQFPMDRFWDFQTVKNFYSFMAQHPSNMCRIEKYGESFEKRELLAAHVGLPSAPNENKRTIMFDGTYHAREWITTMACVSMLNDVMTNTKWQPMVQTFDFVFICCANPDGYEYTWTTNRLWRKTRQPNPENFACPGTDPNRNYDFGHRGEGSSTNPCDETYAGTEPFSAPETKAIKTFSEGLRRLFASVSFHSYSQMYLLSYGCKDEKNIPEYKDFDHHLDIASQSIKALEAVHGTKYTAGNSEAILYPACGTSADWFKGKYKGTGIVHAYTLELRDTGRTGFLLPADQIFPACQETTAAMFSLCESFRKDVLENRV